ncbi:alpha/beta hydrolase family protein [Streptomyces griseorubiginosus]|uniref:alpha/beta hydrolase family protein n=1 Tax=Streptomyces griseorubiginosus TaxID=67304 RepID=UPI0036C94F30
MVNHEFSLESDIPATMTTPQGGGPFPATLLLHGTASHRDEVGGMFADLAQVLAERGIASLRIDFAGCGASPRPQTDYTVTSQLSDARAAHRWLRDHDDIDPTRLGVLGFSQGGVIASLLAGAEHRVRAGSAGSTDAAGTTALATWSSGIIPTARTGFGYFAPAFADGADQAVVDLGFSRFTFSRAWWEEILRLDLPGALDDLDIPVLAVAGSADTIVPPAASLALIEAVASPDLTYVQIPEADHIFSVLDDGGGQSASVITTTADWFADRLTARQGGAAR